MRSGLVAVSLLLASVRGHYASTHSTHLVVSNSRTCSRAVVVASEWYRAGSGVGFEGLRQSWSKSAEMSPRGPSSVLFFCESRLRCEHFRGSPLPVSTTVTVTVPL